jgi:hypothetical protein
MLRPPRRQAPAKGDYPTRAAPSSKQPRLLLCCDASRRTNEGIDRGVASDVLIWEPSGIFLSVRIGMGSSSKDALRPALLG